VAGGIVDFLPIPLTVNLDFGSRRFEEVSGHGIYKWALSNNPATLHVSTFSYQTHKIWLKIAKDAGTNLNYGGHL
jgi:hypothetical protein